MSTSPSSWLRFASLDAFSLSLLMFSISRSNSFVVTQMVAGGGYFVLTTGAAVQESRVECGQAAQKMQRGRADAGEEGAEEGKRRMNNEEDGKAEGAR